jgi:hypothetical protein
MMSQLNKADYKGRPKSQSVCRSGLSVKLYQLV